MRLKVFDYTLCLINAVVETADLLINQGLNLILPESWCADKDTLRDDLRSEGAGQAMVTLRTLLLAIDLLWAFMSLELGKFKQAFDNLLESFRIFSVPPDYGEFPSGKRLMLGQLLMNLHIILAEDLDESLKKQSDGDSRPIGEILSEQKSISQELIDYIEGVQEHHKAQIRLEVNVRSLLIVVAFIAGFFALVGWRANVEEWVFASSILNCLQAQLLLFCASLSFIISISEKIARQFSRNDYSVHWRSLALGLYLIFINTLIPVDEILIHYFNPDTLVNYFWFIFPILLVIIYLPTIKEIVKAIGASEITRKHRFIGGIFLASLAYLSGSFVLSTHHYEIAGQVVQIIGLAMLSCCLILYVGTRIQQAGICISYKA